MNTFKAGFVLIALLVSCLSSHVFANSELRECEYEADIQATYPTHLLQLQFVAMKLGPALCNDGLQITENEKNAVTSTLNEFASLVKKELVSIYPEESFPGMTNFALAWQQQILSYQINPNFLSNFTYKPPSNGPGGPTGPTTFVLPPNAMNDLSLEITPAREGICKATSGFNCEKAATSLYNAAELAFILLDTKDLKANGQNLDRLQKDWRSFIDNARYQTPIDVWFTTLLQSSHFNGPFLVGPPTWQAFLLRPSLVIEHIKDLEKGDRDDASVALEWAGINWWKQGVGVSLTSIYKDRNNVSSIGTGLTFHIKNKYSIGFVHRSDGNNSIFVNIDLLEFLTSEDSSYMEYKKYF